jgi:Flp pilus assembly protein TadG
MSVLVWFARVMRSIWRNSEASAFLEGAILLPVLLTLGLGVFEFSWVFYQQQLISTGVRDAARYIARSTKPNDLTIQVDAKNLATTGDINGGAPRVNGWRANDVRISYASVENASGLNGLTPYRGGPAIETVTVTTTFTVSSLGFFGLLGLRPPSLTVSHQERVIGSG